MSTEFSQSTPSTPPPSSGGEGSGQQSQQPSQQPGQPSSSLTPGQSFQQTATESLAGMQGQGTQQAPLTPTPAAPDPYNEWGGRDRITRGMSIYDSLANDQFEAAKFNDAVAQLSAERYGAIGDDIFDNSPDYFIQKAIANHQDKLLQAMGWDQQLYNEFDQWKKGGGQLQNQPVDPRDTRLQQLESQMQQQAEQRTQYERQSQWQDFTTRLAEPINNLIRELNLPQTEEGGLWAEMISSGAQGLFSADKDAMTAMQTAENYFRNGEYQLGLQKFDQIKAAAELKARKIATLVGRAIKGLAQEQQQTLANGQQQINPMGSSADRSNGGQPSTGDVKPPFGYGPLSYEALKPELDQMLAQRQRR